MRQPRGQPEIARCTRSVASPHPYYLIRAVGTARTQALNTSNARTLLAANPSLLRGTHDRQLHLSLPCLEFTLSPGRE
jgi:hypothetical protein